jgi:hypothetical protein
LPFNYFIVFMVLSILDLCSSLACTQESISKMMFEPDGYLCIYVMEPSIDIRDFHNTCTSITCGEQIRRASSFLSRVSKASRIALKVGNYDRKKEITKKGTRTCSAKIYLPSFSKEGTF